MRPTLGNDEQKKKQPPPGSEQKRQPPSVGVPGQYPVPCLGSTLSSYGYGLSCTKSPTPSRCGWNVSASQRTPYANRSLDLYIAAPAANSSTGTSAANASLRPALVCIHGGSYSGGYALNGAEHCGAALTFFASAGWVVFAINYRLRGDQGNVPPGWPVNCGNPAMAGCAPHAERGDLRWMPEYGYPAVRDAKAAIRYVRANAAHRPRGPRLYHRLWQQRRCGLGSGGGAVVGAAIQGALCVCCVCVLCVPCVLCGRGGGHAVNTRGV